MAIVSNRDFTEDLDSSRTGLTFDSEHAAFGWATVIANDLRFNIIRSSKKKRLKMIGQYQHYFTCACAVRKEKLETREKRLEKKGFTDKLGKLKKRLTGSKRVGCEFRGVIRTERDGNYHVTIFEGRHNHPLTYYVEGNPNYTRLTEEEKLTVREMYRSHCKPKVIVDALQHCDAEKPYLRRPVYNEVAKFKREQAEGRNPARQFFELARRRDYFTRFQEEPGTKQLKDIFWSHPNGRKMLRCYPNIFCIDATYSTNKYNYALVEIIGVAPTNQNFTAAQALLQREDKGSYMWVMRCLSELLGDGVYPQAIVTDRELGLMEPIATVFPLSHHVLCMHHVKKMIRAKAVTVLKTKKAADSLCHGPVRKLLESITVEEYTENERELRTNYAWVPRFIKYMDDIWLPHKEKIVFAWTNKVMHYGNNTTNRVESAHSAMKDWMKSCRGGLDTLFDETHAEVEGQTKEIRCKLEQSLSKNLEGFDVPPYMLLLRRVSHYCLTVLRSEAAKMGICSHAMPSTHGLPCRCQLLYLEEKNDFIFPETVNSFWTTLVYDGEAVEQPKCAYDMSKMVEDYQQRDVADQFQLSQIFHSHMYPEQWAYMEPSVNVTKKGRPAKGKKKAKTNRELSHWEHVDKKFGTGPSSQASNGGTNEPSVEKQHILGSWDVPEFVREYLLAVDDVEGDGNCGFRCAALKFLGNEDMYVTVRQLMVAEIRAHPDVYKTIYQKNENDVEVEKAISRINWTGNRCTSGHWMETPCDLFALAQVFRAVVSLYTVDKLGRHGCCTVFPWRGKISDFKKVPEMSIIYRVKKLHYVLGHFWPDDGSQPDNPLPTIHPSWPGIRHRSLSAWQSKVYAQRLSRFTDLQNIYNGYIGNEEQPDLIDLDD